MGTVHIMQLLARESRLPEHALWPQRKPGRFGVIPTNTAPGFYLRARDADGIRAQVAHGSAGGRRALEKMILPASCMASRTPRGAPLWGSARCSAAPGELAALRPPLARCPIALSDGGRSRTPFWRERDSSRIV